MENFSLIDTPWLPARYRDGSVRLLAPVDLCDENLIDLACSRSDLQGAAWQFLIGLIQTVFAPKDEDDWMEVWEEGIDSEAFKSALKKVENAFYFGPKDPSFMQDSFLQTQEAVGLNTLIPELPGSITIKENKDIFIKRGISSKSAIWVLQT